jgi:ribose transport system ATP-binding protein
MSALTKQGKSIILISSDMPELVSMSDRVIVIHKGEITRELAKEEITEQAIIKSALEVTEHA